MLTSKDTVKDCQSEEKSCYLKNQINLSKQK